MLDAVKGTVISWVISLMLFNVPKEQTIKHMEAIPGPTEKNIGFDLRGWTFEHVVSSETGQDHHYYSFPSRRENAPCFVMLHGFNTDGRTFLNLKGLSQSYNLIAYDFPESTSLYTGKFSDFSILLSDFFHTLDFDTVCLLGNSIGGAVAVEFAATHKEFTVGNLVLVSTAIFGADRDQQEEQKAMADKLLDYPDYKLFYLVTRARNIIELMEKTPLEINVSEEVMQVKRIDWYRQVFTALRNYNGTRYARQITCPVLAVHGTKDNLIELEQAKTITDLIPHARFVGLEGLGHAMVYEEADTVAAVIREYCARFGE